MHNPCYEIELDRYTFAPMEIVTITFLFSEKACIGFTLQGDTGR